MPELPEVETIANDLRRAGIVGENVIGITVYTPSILTTPSPAQFSQLICGRTITAVGRRGKYLIFSLSNGMSLIVHLRMTGRFLWGDPDKPPNPHEHVIINLSHRKQLRYHDTRKFGRWYLVYDTQEVLGKLGPEPLDDQFTFPIFKKLLAGKSRQIKPLLLDQQTIAGLGNIYVDEALWEAKIHPECPVNAISVQQLQDLYKAIRLVLKRGLKTEGTSLGMGRTNFYRLDGTSGRHQHHLNVFRQTGKLCPRCHTPIIRIVVGQRSTHLCPHCQKTTDKPRKK
jgi:formamidopyrimidine-DNA glycosylase